MARVGDVDSTGIGATSIDASNQQCGGVSAASNVGRVYLFDCSSSPLSGRYVTIQSQAGNQLRVYELTIYREGDRHTDNSYTVSIFIVKYIFRATDIRN